MNCSSGQDWVTPGCINHLLLSRSGQQLDCYLTLISSAESVGICKATCTFPIRFNMKRPAAVQTSPLSSSPLTGRERILLPVEAFSRHYKTNRAWNTTHEKKLTVCSGQCPTVLASMVKKIISMLFKLFPTSRLKHSIKWLSLHRSPNKSNPTSSNILKKGGNSEWNPCFFTKTFWSSFMQKCLKNQWDTASKRKKAAFNYK